MPSSPSTPDHYRIVVLGGAGVGKTALVHRFLYDTFTSEHVRTVEELHRGKFADGNVVVDIIDTSGSYEFPAMRRLAVASADALILVYAVDQAHSFEEVRRLRWQLLEHIHKPILVVGNKCDLERRREVRQEVADTIVHIDWEDRFLEASAKRDYNIGAVFQEILIMASIQDGDRQQMKQRRTSLPYLALQKGGKVRKGKRNSCAVS